MQNSLKREMNYFRVLEERNRKVDGIAPWLCSKKNEAWIITCRDWENGLKEKILSLPKNFRTVVQAGGHQGLYPRLLAEHFDTVYTFEPHPLNFYCLVNNCQKDNIIKIQAALGDKNTFVMNENKNSINMGENKVLEGGLIPQIVLDIFPFENVDFLCLDVEGYELNVLKGAKELIIKHRPLISVENAGEEITKFLFDFEYEFVFKFRMDSFFSYNNGVNKNAL